MILNDSGNIFSGSSSMLLILDIVSILYIDSFVVFWFLLLGDRDSASATMFFSPEIYSFYGLYYSSICLPRSTLYVMKLLHVRFLWSVYIFNF